MKTSFSNLSALLVLCLSFSIFSCANDSGQNSKGSIDPQEMMTSKQIRDEAQADHDSLADVGPIHLKDANMSQVVNSLYGGSDGLSFQKFIDDRISYFLSQDEYNNLLDNTFHGEFGSSKDDTTTSSSQNHSGVEVGGANVGLSLWFNSALNGYTSVQFNFRGKDVIMDSPHVGLMLIGPAYHLVDRNKDGTSYVYPKAFRQSILIHEARHSDCPTGITPKDLAFIRAHLTDDNALEKLHKLTCGHTHSICPAGHPYATFPACDKMPWGAYTAGGLFAGIMSNVQSNEVDHDAMLMVMADSIGRLLFDYKSMFAGQMGTPDLTSKGLVAN